MKITNSPSLYEMREQLERAIVAYKGDTGPGIWTSVIEDRDEPLYVELRYTVRDDTNTPYLADFVCEEENAYFWEHCGGAAILRLARLSIPEVQMTFGDLDNIDGQTEFIFSARFSHLSR